MWKGKSGGGSGHAETTLIGNGAVLEGTIKFAGVLEVEGRINGDILAVNDDQAVVRILGSGQVYGDIDVPLIVINGAVSGNIRSADHIELAANAVVNGDVYYNLIEMVKGAQVNGSLVFSEPVQAVSVEPGGVAGEFQRGGE